MSRRCFGGDDKHWEDENDDRRLRINNELGRDNGGCWFVLVGLRHFVVGVPSLRITMVIYVGISGDFEEDCEWGLLFAEELNDKYDNNFDVVGVINDGVSNVMKDSRWRKNEKMKEREREGES